MSTSTKTGLIGWLRRSYLRKLLSMLLVVGFLVAAVGGVIYVQTTDELADRTESELTKSAEIQAETIAEWSDRNRDHATTLASAEVIQRGNRASITALLSTETAQLPDSASGIHYLAANTGNVAASSIEGAIGTSYSEVRWMQMDGRLPENGETIVTTTYSDPVTGEDAVAFLAAVPQTDYLIVIPINLHPL